MENEKIIEKIIEKLDAYYKEYDIKQYLVRHNIDVSNFSALFEQAKTQYHESIRKKEAQKNALFFWTTVALAIAAIAFFGFYLPAALESKDAVAVPFIGAFLISVFALLAYVFYGIWMEPLKENLEPKTVNYSGLFVIALFPTMLLYFIISTTFESTAEALLKQNQVETTGEIISGSGTELTNLKGQTVDFAKLVVRFETENGQTIIANKDVSKYEFQNHYYGEQVPLIYSKTNPQNFEFLSSDATVKNYRGTEERALKINDLFVLFNKNETEITKTLNGISYGWTYDSYKKMWTNTKRDVAVMVTGNTIKYLSTDFFTFPLELQRKGFKTVTTLPQNATAKERLLTTFGNKIYTNDTLYVSIERMGNNDSNGMATLTTIVKVK